MLPVNESIGTKAVVSVYSMTMGALIIVFWSVLWLSETVPDLLIKPWEIAMHLSTEFTTVGLLLVSGWGLWFGAH